jgi:ParB family chromosome partitioning protein
MEYIDISIDKLQVSHLNVRKTLSSEEDETGIEDLANDIKNNGLINPITVRKLDNSENYEIIAGQRRFLAIKLLNNKTISCHILNISNQKAEEISLVENVQRNQMTTTDKVKAYSKLYEVYNKDIEKVVNAIHISKKTLQKYLKIKNLPEEVLHLLDAVGEDKISLDVAIELTKLPPSINTMTFLNKIQQLTSQQKVESIKQFNFNHSTNIDDLDTIKEDIVCYSNNIRLAPSFPYVIDKNDKYIKIPETLYEDIINIIQLKTGNIEYI